MEHGTDEASRKKGLLSTMKTDTKLSHQIAAQLAAALQNTKPKITELVQSPIPSISSIRDIISTIKQILFPGFCDSQDYPTESLDLFLELNVESLLKQLTHQISIALALDQKFKSTNEDVVFDQDIDADAFYSSAKSLAETFGGRLASIRERLSTDIQAAYDGDPACKNVGEVILCYPGLQAILVHRVAHELYNMEIPYLPRMMAEWIHGETGIDIHPGAQIGKHFFIDHGTGVVIGETCEIGQHVKIYQGVTLGALSFPTDGNGDLVRDTKRHPTIEDNVVIYANATILGGKTVIGHHSIVGSSVWLTDTVAPFTTILMEKPKLHLRDGRPDRLQNKQNYHI